MRAEKYFAWQHLPKHLQNISKPFEGVSKDKLLGGVDILIMAVKEFPSYDVIETATCLSKLKQMKTEKSTTKALRLLLEAKDCAVRAALP